MSEQSEAQRIELNVDGETAPPVEVRLVCTTANQVNVALHKVREVMTLVALQRTAGWQDDSWWESRLPVWFVRSFQDHSIDDILKDPYLWDFGSWLDAMKGPGWEWWSSSEEEAGWIINVSAHCDPYSIDPLMYLCRTAGADVVAIKGGRS